LQGLKARGIGTLARANVPDRISGQPIAYSNELKTAYGTARIQVRSLPKEPQVVDMPTTSRAEKQATADASTTVIGWFVLIGIFFLIALAIACGR
jgi:hypothetical protein